METSLHRLCAFFQVILAYESIVLCMCSGKYIDIYFIMKITYFAVEGALEFFLPGSLHF